MIRPLPAALALLVAATTSVAFADTFVVNSFTDSNDASPGNGVCDAGGGLCSLRAAVQEANAWAGQDTIELPTGTHVVSLDNTHSGLPISVDSDIDIVGSGVGDAVIYVDSVLWISNAIFEVNALSPVNDLTLTHLTMDIRSGGAAVRTTGTCAPPSCPAASATLDDVELLATTAPGGIFGTSPLLESTGFGGEMTLRNVSILEGRSPASFYITYAAYGGELTIEDTVIDGGGVHATGVGVNSQAGGVIVRRTTIRNLGAGAFGFDGAIWINAQVAPVTGVLVDDCTFESVRRGLKVRNLGHSVFVQLRRTLVRGASLEGANLEGPVTAAFVDMTMSDVGTGVALVAPTSGAGLVDATLERVTIADATTTIDVADGMGTLTAVGSILAGGGTECVGTVTSAGYNLIEGACTVAGDTTGNVTDTSPLLEALADNGGPTWTHALMAGSPALDAGPPDTVSGCGSDDQRGYLRPGDGDGDGDRRCDIGAFELVDPIFVGGGFDDGTFAAWSAVVGGP